MSIGWGHARTYARTCMYIGGQHVNWVGPCKDICTCMHVHRWTACQLGGAMRGHMHVHVRT